MVSVCVFILAANCSGVENVVRKALFGLVVVVVVLVLSLIEVPLGAFATVTFFFGCCKEVLATTLNGN